MKQTCLLVLIAAAATSCGNAPDADPPDAAVRYRVGVRAMGVTAPVSLRLTVAGSEELLTVTADGDLGFVLELVPGTSYVVELAAQVPCAVQGGIGTIDGADAQVVLVCGMLDNLEITGPGGTPGPDLSFVATTLGYGATVSLLQSSTTVTATASGTDMSITVAGEAVESGVAGAPVALELGDTVIPVEVSHAASGARLVYEITVSRAGEIVYAKASNTDAGDQFGNRVALSGDGSTLAVGAQWEDSAATDIDGDQADNSAADSGAVYVLSRSSAGWVQVAYVKASNTDADDRFGSSVALSADGNTLAVGAHLEDSAATGVGGDEADNSAADSGAVYVFRRSGGTWAREAYIKASNAGPGDLFGNSVALSADGSALAVSAHMEDSAANNSGAVYVFRRGDAGWAEETYVTASNADAGDWFGTGVALSGDGSTLAVGTYREDSTATGVGGDEADNSAANSGAVYVFRRSGATWAREAYIKASNTGAGDLFGNSVALSGDGSTLSVGAYREDSAATDIDGDQASSSAGDSGAVYVFRRGDAGWAQEAYVKVSNTGAGDELGAGSALSADGSTLAVSARGEDSAATDIDGDQADNSAGGSGAVYVFRRSGAAWTQEMYVKASNTGAGDRFGNSVALSGDGSTLAVPAVWEDSAATDIGGDQLDNGAVDSGAVYIFR